MSEARTVRGRRLVAAALARAEAFLLEPVEPAVRPAAVRVRPVVAVVGLAPRCGATVAARALAVELAARDPAGAAVVAGDRGGTGPLRLAASASGRLARALGSAAGGEPRVAGRLCLVEGPDPRRLADSVRHLAPLVFDVAHGEPAGAAASLADHLLLVASTAVEPALATLVASSLGRVGPAPMVVLSGVHERGREWARWRDRAAVELSRSATGARLALAGRDPRGTLGAGVAALGERCVAPLEEW